MFRLKEGRISSNGLFNVLVVLVISNIFLGLPRAMAAEAASGAWLLMLSSGLFAAGGVFFMVRLLKKFPGKNFVEIAEILGGRVTGILVALVFAALALTVAVVSLREFSETMLTTVMPRTPISVVAFFFIVTMIFGAYQGIEVITRTSTLLFPFIIGAILIILTMTANSLNLNNLFPILGTGPDHIIFHAPGRSSAFIEIILVGLIASNIADNKNTPKQIWAALLVSLAVFIMVEVVYIAVFRVSAAERLYVPLFQLARIIYMGRFIQRIEAIFIFVWFFTGALKLTVALYIAATTLSRAFRIPIYQPLLFSLALLVFALSFIPPDIVTAVLLETEVIREYSALPGWGLPVALLILSGLRKKGGSQLEKENSG